MKLIALKIKLHVVDKTTMDLELSYYILECLYLPQLK